MFTAPQSRFCASCRTSWPNDQRFTACPVCDVPTSMDHGTTSEFVSGDDAMVEVLRRRRLAEFEEFDATYDEACLLADLATIERSSPADLAAQFAKLNEQPSASTKGGPRWPSP